MIQIVNYSDLKNGFGVWCPNEVFCLIVDRKYFYQKYKHVGWLQTSIRENQLIIASENEQDLADYITTNNLQDINGVLNVWHDEAMGIKIVQHKDDNIAMLRLYGELAIYKRDNNIEDFEEYNYIYFYVNYIYKDHYDLLMNFGCSFNVKEGYELYFDETDNAYRSKLKQ